MAGHIKNGLVKSGHQRRALAAGRHVAAAQVGDDIDARQFGQQGRVVQLARKAQFGAVADGLAMRADGGDGVRTDASVVQ